MPLELLERLSNAAGVSGDESAVRKIIAPALKNHVDDLHVDTMGNLYAAKHGPDRLGLTLMVTAHMDEVGFMITRITGSGLLEFAPVGGFDRRILPGKTVLVGPHNLPGVIGLEAIHNVSPETRADAPAISALAIDIGASGKEEAAAKVRLGDYAVFNTRFSRLSGPADNPRAGVVKGKALDNRVGCALLVELLRQDYPFNLVGVFTVQEEVGLRGAQVAAHKINPDTAIVLECTTADDLPAKKDRPAGYPRLGDGPCLTLMDRSFIAGRKLAAQLEAVAAKHAIPWQYKKPGLGGTDAGAIHKTRAGIPTAVISVPARYIHSPAALINLADFWRALELVSAALKEFPSNWK